MNRHSMRYNPNHQQKCIRLYHRYPNNQNCRRGQDLDEEGVEDGVVEGMVGRVVEGVVERVVEGVVERVVEEVGVVD